MSRKWLLCTTLLTLVGYGVVTRHTRAGTNPEMCGDGTTFRVNLPGTAQLPDGSYVPPDIIDVPNHCSIYALLVSGYERNKNFDELTFYSFAKYVAEHNGYVHWAWWNNLLQPYMNGPLHEKAVTIPGFGTKFATPGGLIGSAALGFAPVNTVGGGVDTLVPKAIPEEDDQFQIDAELMLKAIRAHVPNAIIVVAGHSMGGAAVARLGAATSVDIDLLAPIDPVGNRTYPVGEAGQTYNWTRWRATHAFTGYRQMDCTRDSNHFCIDYDPRLFYKEYHCGPVGPVLDRPPLIGSKAPLVCPGMWTDPGKRVTFKSNIHHLLYRWQREAVFPFDFNKDYTFVYSGGDTASVPGPLIPAQRGLDENIPSESDRDKTCKQPPGLPKKPDPRDSTVFCNSSDGHGEIIGFRGLDTNGAIPVGLLAQNWPPPTGRRTGFFLQMPTKPSPDPSKITTDSNAWTYEPLNPNLDMVVDDMKKILDKILSLVTTPVEDTTPPVTLATTDPDPSDSGWNNTDVDVDFSATDNPQGSGVKEIHYFFAGAQATTIVAAGATAHDTISAEGITAVNVFARDIAGNNETAQTFDVKIDKTPPVIQALPDVPANAAGWNKTDVHVHFTASDPLSGIAAPPADVVASAEGAQQEISGSATDNAGNQGAASVILNIDKTPPVVTLTAPADGAVLALGSVVAAAYGCTDTLSGVASCIGSVVSTTPIDTSTVGPHQFTVTATDAAGNTSSVVHTYSVAGQPRLVLTVAGKGIDAGGHYYVDVQIKNTGAGIARDVTIGGVIVRTLTGTGTGVVNAGLSPLPAAVGDLDINAVTTARLYLDLPVTVLRFSITESGACRDALGGSLSYSSAQSVIR